MARAPAPPAPRADAVVVGDHERPMHPTDAASAAPGRVGNGAGGGRPAQPRGLPCGTALLVATGVPHDPHMAVHALEDQLEDTGHMVVHQRGLAQGTCDGTLVLGNHDRRSRDPAARLPGDQPWRQQGAERGPTDPQPPRRPVTLHRPQRGVAQPHRVLLDPGGLGPHLFRRVRGRTL